MISPGVSDSLCKGAERGELRRRLGKLLRAALRPGTRVSIGPPCRAEWQKVVEDDAGPFDLVGVEQESAARHACFIQTKPLPQAVDEMRMQRQRHRHVRLAEEIRDELGRIVSAGIFEVEEGDAALVA